MKFEKISIRNFRNFENIEIGISNKNIFFGLNDIGKTKAKQADVYKCSDTVLRFYASTWATARMDVVIKHT